MSFLSPAGELAKMYLIAYETNEQDAQKVTVGDLDKFTFQVNPENYKRRFGIQYTNTGRTPGTMSDPGTYNNATPETFTVDILSDNTGIIVKESLLSVAIVNPVSPDTPQDVTAQIEVLKQFCYNYQ